MGASIALSSATKRFIKRSWSGFSRGAGSSCVMRARYPIQAISSPPTWARTQCWSPEGRTAWYAPSSMSAATAATGCAVPTKGTPPPSSAPITAGPMATTASSSPCPASRRPTTTNWIHPSGAYSQWRNWTATKDWCSPLSTPQPHLCGPTWAR